MTLLSEARFAVVRGIWLRALPHQDGERLVYLRHSALATGEENVYFSVPEIADIRTRAKAFKGVVEFSSMTFTVQSGRADFGGRLAVVDAG